MFLRITITILLVINLIFMPSAYSKDCAIPTDDLKIFITWDDKAWELTWHVNKIQKKKSSYSGAYSAERTNVVKGSSDQRSKRLPQYLVLPDERFDVPFDISRNGELLITSIYDNFIVLIPSKKFAVVDIKKKQIIRILETDYYVNSLAWAPNGNLFAVLFTEDVTKQTLKRFGPLNLFADFLGHPISYYTFYLSLYDSKGTLVCMERISETIPLGRGYIEWGK